MSATPLHPDQLVSRRNFWASLRWGSFVTLFLVAQMGLAYAAIQCAGSDGGAQAIPGADVEIAKSYSELGMTSEERTTPAEH